MENLPKFCAGVDSIKGLLDMIVIRQSEINSGNVLFDWEIRYRRDLYDKTHGIFQSLFPPSLRPPTRSQGCLGFVRTLF